MARQIRATLRVVVLAFLGSTYFGEADRAVETIFFGWPTM